MVDRFISSDHKRLLLNWCPTLDYCLLASGKIEVVIHDGVNLFDFAAGKLIALEAGAQVFRLDGKAESDFTEGKFIIANSDKHIEHFVKILKG